MGKVGPIDKKVEKAIKSELMARFHSQAETQLADEKPEAIHSVLQYLAVKYGCYFGLGAAEADWATRLTAN